MKNNRGFLFLLLACLLGLASCISSRNMEDALGHYYGYKFGIRQNKANWKECRFTNDTLDIQFAPAYTSVHFTVLNKLGRPFLLLMDKAWFSDPSGMVSASFSPDSSGTPFSPLTIASGEKYAQALAPVQNKIAGKSSGQISLAEIYPSYDSLSVEKSKQIMGSLANDLFTLHIPVSVDGHIREYAFTFFPIEIERHVSPKF